MSRFSSLSYGAAAIAFVVVLVPYKILIHEDEDEYEKAALDSTAFDLSYIRPELMSKAGRK